MGFVVQTPRPVTSVKHINNVHRKTILRNKPELYEKEHILSLRTYMFSFFIKLTRHRFPLYFVWLLWTLFLNSTNLSKMSCSTSLPLSRWIGARWSQYPLCKFTSHSLVSQPNLALEMQTFKSYHERIPKAAKMKRIPGTWKRHKGGRGLNNNSRKRLVMNF